MIVGRPLPSELRDRLRPIVMLFSSSNDGELVAAARSIGRLLQKHGCDWTDFTDHMAADRAVAPLPQGEPSSPASAWGADTGGRQIDAAQLIRVIEAIRKSRVWLSPSSREFLNGLECRAPAYSSVNLSERQHQCLLDLAQAAAKA